MSALYRLLADNLPARGGKVALIDAGRQATYDDLHVEAGRLAAWLAGRGVRPGDRVVVHLRKGIDEVAAMFAAWRLGAVVVNVNAQWSAGQLAHVAGDCRAAAAILPPGPAAGLTGRGAILTRGPGTPPPGAERWEDLPPAPDAPEARPDPAALAAIIYTSGSTGLPKGVMLSHDNIRIGADAVISYLRLGGDDRLLGVLPYSFDAGLNQLTTMFRTGGQVVHQPVTLPAEVIRMARDRAVTGLAGVPPLWNQIVRTLADAPVPLPALRRITNTGGKIPPDILAQMPAVFPGVDICLMYGLTEAFRATWLPPAKFAAKAGAIGQAIPHAEIHVVKPDGTLAGPGEQGELVQGGPLVSLGYWERPDLTAQKIRPCPALGPDPVVWSGDLVRVDADGDLWFVGRMDDMIKSMGFRISPTEVEDAVHATGLATDVVAWGEEDADRGQAVAIAASLTPGADPAALTAALRRTMPAYMVPCRIHPWAGAMPRTASGKLDRPQVIAACRAARTEDMP